MLGFQYVVAKSLELSSALDRELSGASNRSAPFSSVSTTSFVEISASNGSPEAPTESRNEGHAFLIAQQNLQDQTISNHQKLMLSGQDLDAALARARTTLQAQVASEQFLAQNFHLVSKVRLQLAGVRNLVLKLVEEADEVENLLVHRCEENAARQNAEFATKQQQELEKFEAEIEKESEGRKREMLEMRRQKLASTFMNDLRTYQTLVAHHGDAAAAEATGGEEEKLTLDEVDLVVTADPEQLDAFYDSNSDQEEEMQSPRFASPPVPKGLEEEEEKDAEQEEETVEPSEKTEKEAPAEDEGHEKAEKAEEVVAEVVETDKEEGKVGVQVDNDESEEKLS